MNWEDYFYPDTDILRNEKELMGRAGLLHYERRAAGFRDAELRKNPVVGSYDLKHLQAIHRYLFQDVYPWAGELRGVELKEGRTLYTFKAFLQRDGAALGEFVRDQRYLRGLDKISFASQLAGVYMHLSILHPFRQGNGRSARVYLAQLAHGAGYRFEHDNIGHAEWIHATKVLMKGNVGGIWVNRDLNDLTPIGQIMAKNLKVERALAFEDLSRERALAKHPELDGAMGVLDEARRDGRLKPSVFEEIARELHEGHLVTKGSHDQSLEAIQLAAQARGAYLRRVSGLSGIVKGNVIGVSSHHVLVRVDNTTALYFDRTKLDREVYADDDVSILVKKNKSYVFEKDRELIGAMFMGRKVEKIDFSKNGAGEGERFNLSVTLADGSVQSFADTDRRRLKEAFGEKHANYIDAKAREGKGELSCCVPLPAIDGEPIVAGQTYTGLILSDDCERIVQLTNTRKIVVHDREHLSGANKRFQAGDKVSISYSHANVGLVCSEYGRTVAELVKERKRAE